MCKLNFLLFSLPHNAWPQIMLLTDPEIESSLLISSDEGATYQKYRLNFYIQSLLFHPKQEDWILAYSQDQKVSVITLLETTAHGFPGSRLLANCLCISSWWWLWFGAVPELWARGSGAARRISGCSLELCLHLKQHVRQKPETQEDMVKPFLTVAGSNLKMWWAVRSSQPLWNLRLFCACGDMTVFLGKGPIAFLKPL